MSEIFYSIMKPMIEEAFREINQNLDRALANHGIDGSDLKLGHKINRLIEIDDSRRNKSDYTGIIALYALYKFMDNQEDPTPVLEWLKNHEHELDQDDRCFLSEHIEKVLINVPMELVDKYEEILKWL